MASDLYSNGASIREVAHQLNLPRSTARLAILRENPILKRDKSFPKRPTGGCAPYGFVRINSKLIKDEREQKVIQFILGYYKKGMSLNGISKALNQQKIRPRSAKLWHNTTVRSLVLRELNKYKKEKK